MIPNNHRGSVHCSNQCWLFLFNDSQLRRITIMINYASTQQPSVTNSETGNHYIHHCWSLLVTKWYFLVLSWSNTHPTSYMGVSQNGDPIYHPFIYQNRPLWLCSLHHQLVGAPWSVRCCMVPRFGCASHNWGGMAMRRSAQQQAVPMISGFSRR